MLEEREEEFISTGNVVDSQGEREEGPTSIDVIDKPILLEESAVVVPQEEKLQEQNQGMEQIQEESQIGRKEKRRRRITSYLTDISRQADKQGNQINKIITMIQSVQKQRQPKSTTGIERVSQAQSQSIKQIQSQLSQLQKQVTRIQKEIQRIRTASTKRTASTTKRTASTTKRTASTTKRTKAKARKPLSTTTSSANVKSRSKKSKSPKSNKARKGKRGIK